MPVKAQGLLDLYREEIGLSERDYSFMLRLLTTAYHEGRLARLQEEYNQINPNIHAEEITIQHLS